MGHTWEGSTEGAEQRVGAGTLTLRPWPLIEIGRPYCRQSLASYMALSFLALLEFNLSCFSGFSW